MSKHVIFAALASVLLVLGMAAQAAAQSKGQQGLFIKSQSSSQVLASSITGMVIQDGEGKQADQIGTVNDLIMNKQHQLVGIVVGVGGFLGIGQKNVGIRWEEIRNIDTKKDVAVVTVTKEQLNNAPAFTNKQEQQKKHRQKRMKQQQQKKQSAPVMGNTKGSGD